MSKNVDFGWEKAFLGPSQALEFDPIFRAKYRLLRWVIIG